MPANAIHSDLLKAINRQAHAIVSRSFNEVRDQLAAQAQAALAAGAIRAEVMEAVRGWEGSFALATTEHGCTVLEVECSPKCDPECPARVAGARV